MFQFLIGRLATLILNDHYTPLKSRFNSLQVGSQPYSLKSFSKTFIEVSIPYRQARNRQMIDRILNTYKGFNSLQVGSQHFEIWKTVYTFDSFNSLQVGSQLFTIFGENFSMGSFNSLQVGSQLKFLSHKTFASEVSIPYRQARNFVNLAKNLGKSKSFNSLQVGSQPYF